MQDGRRDLNTEAVVDFSITVSRAWHWVDERKSRGTRGQGLNTAESDHLIPQTV